VPHRSVHRAACDGKAALALGLPEFEVTVRVRGRMSCRTCSSSRCSRSSCSRRRRRTPCCDGPHTTALCCRSRGRRR